MTMNFYAPTAGEVVRVRLEDAGDPTKFIVAESFVTDAGWQEVRIDFARQVDGQFNPAVNYNKVTVYPGYGHTGTGQVYYIDDVRFLDAVAPEPAGETITFAVTVANVGGKDVYHIDGVAQDSLDLVPGNTYVFDYTDASNYNPPDFLGNSIVKHPLVLSTDPDGHHGDSNLSPYQTGVTYASGRTTVVVDEATPPLYYYCYVHSGMGGSADIASPDRKSHV